MNPEINIMSSRIKSLEDEVKTLKAQLNAQSEIMKKFETALNMLDAEVDNIKERK